MWKKDCWILKISVKWSTVSVNIKSEGNFGRIKFVKCSFSLVPNLRSKNPNFHLYSLCEKLHSKVFFQPWRKTLLDIILEQWNRVCQIINRTVFGQICWILGSQLNLKLCVSELLLNSIKISQTVPDADIKSFLIRLTK